MGRHEPKPYKEAKTPVKSAKRRASSCTQTRVLGSSSKTACGTQNQSSQRYASVHGTSSQNPSEIRARLRFPEAQKKLLPPLVCGPQGRPAASSGSRRLASCGARRTGPWRPQQAGARDLFCFFLWGFGCILLTKVKTLRMSELKEGRSGWGHGGA